MNLARIIKGLALGVALLAAGGLTLLYVGQDHLIYHPVRYGPRQPADRLAKAENFLPYATEQGSQTAFYFQPGQSPPRHLWVMFSGNASLALFTWTNLIRANADRHDAFLLLDYPGFGFCAGHPSPAGIEESANAALSALHQKLGAPLPPLRVIGYSLGAATALQFAASHDVDRVVLLAPFTNISDMGRHLYHLWFVPGFFIRDNFDNRARLAELARRRQPPRVIIFHGTDDECVPVAMGRELARRHPLMVTLHELPGRDHTSIFADLSLIISAMQ
jgi:pimeloyl-ACP methyl ester carboxylesterase